MYCGLDFQDPDGLLQLSLLLVARRYHLIRSLDKSWSREIDVRAIELRSLFPVTYLAAIDASNGGITIFFNVAGFKALTTGGGRGRREGCIKIDLCDPWDDIRKFEGGYIGDWEIVIRFFIELIESVTSSPTVIPPTSMANLVVVASDFDRSMARTQGFVNHGNVGGEAIVGRGSVFNWFFGFFSEGGRQSSNGNWRGGSLFDKGGSYGSGWCSTLPWRR